MRLTKEECFRSPFEKLNSWTRVYHHAQEKAAADSLGYDGLSYIVASMATGSLADRSFFPVSNLPNLFKRNYNNDCLTDFVPGIEAPLASSRIHDSNCGSKIVHELSNIGVSYLSFLTYGTRSLVFRPLTESQERPPLIMFTPTSDPLPASPFHLPAYKLIWCENIYIRFMPELATDRKEDAAKELNEKLGSFGLSVSDVAGYNVGHYIFRGIGGRVKKVPMIFDWNSGPVELSEKQKLRLKCAPSVAPWHSARRHIARHGKHAIRLTSGSS